jgi:hypothetical protein
MLPECINYSEVATQVYDYLTAPLSDRGTISSNTGVDAILYPEPYQVNVFGPIYTPRVYGKDLTSFELASSGTIAVTLADVASFFLERDLASSNITLRTACNDSFEINVKGGAMGLLMDSAANDVTLFSDSNVLVSASNTLTLAAPNLVFDSDAFAFGVDGALLSITPSNIEMNTASNIDIHALEYLDLHSSSNARIQADSNLYLDANALTFNGSSFVVNSSSNIVLSTPDTMWLTACNLLYDFSNITVLGTNIASAGDTISLSAPGALFTVTESNISSYSSNVMHVEGSNVSIIGNAIVSVTSMQDLTLSALGAAASLGFAVSNTLDVLTATADEFKFKTSNVDVITATAGQVNINGDLKVDGTIKYSQSVSPSNLRVFDKTILLAYDADTPVTDGNLNDQAGIEVRGSGKEKSFKWNHKNGVGNLGTSNIDDESYWELKGGAFRMSEGDHSFGFRINDLGEFELVKKVGQGNFKRIAKFGKALI